jgi:hypothetical protein
MSSAHVPAPDVLERSPLHHNVAVDAGGANVEIEQDVSVEQCIAQLVDC